MKTHCCIAAVCLGAVVLAGCSSTPHAISHATAPCCAPPNVAAAGVSAETSTTAAVAAAPAADELFITPWLPPEQRPAVTLTNRVTLHDGRVTTFRELLDRPVAIAFAYSRCENPNKCPRVVSAMGQLRGDLERAGRLDSVRLLVVTYDPAYDSPVIMRRFAKLNGLRLDDHALFLKPEPDPEHQLFRELQAPASFNENGVAIHGIQLLLLDKRGRLARTYRTLLWDNNRAASDLAQLARE